MNIQNSITIEVIKDLQDDINRLKSLKTNIEILWELERLHRQEILLKSAELIRKSLK